MKQKYCISACAVLASLISSVGQAQNSSDSEIVSNWWQIEVILFTQGNNWATTSEIWPTDVELSYPNKWQVLTPLVDPNAVDAELNPDNLDGEPARDLVDNRPDQNQPNDLPDEDEEEEEADSLGPELLKLLPEEELQLTDLAQKLNRNRRRILFHGAWRQFMERYQEEAPIIFSAGEQYDDHYELEGSIHIYYQRLLHFDVNLWLTEFSINAGQERLPWPDLPKPPTQVEPLLSLTELDQPTPAELNNSGFNTSESLSNGTFTNNPSANNPNANIGTINTLDWFDQRGNVTFYDSRYDEILSRNYVVNNLATIKEDRPIRSNELHYIDHPLVGILVKMTLFEPPVPPEAETDILDELLGPRPE